MVNPNELAICKRRGHKIISLGPAWQLCDWCGAWVREVITIEEREDEPPKEEQDGFDKLRRETLDRKKERPKESR